jgi:hypothetical protein
MTKGAPSINMAGALGLYDGTDRAWLFALTNGNQESNNVHPKT